MGDPTVARYIDNKMENYASLHIVAMKPKCRLNLLNSFFFLPVMFIVRDKIYM